MPTTRSPPFSGSRIGRALSRMLGDADPARSRRVMEAMLQMKKMDLRALERAYEG